MSADDRIMRHQREMVRRTKAERQFDQHIRIVVDRIPWRTGEPEPLLVDLEREATNTQPCKATFPSWYEPVDIND